MEKFIEVMEKDKSNFPNSCDGPVSTTKYKPYIKVPYPLNENGDADNYIQLTITINKQYLFLNINNETGDYYYQIIDTAAGLKPDKRDSGLQSGLSAGLTPDKRDSGLQHGKLDISAAHLPIIKDVRVLNNNIIVISYIDEKYIINVYSIDIGFNKWLNVNPAETDFIMKISFQFTYTLDSLVGKYESISIYTFNSKIFYIFATVPGAICMLNIYKFNYITGFIEEYIIKYRATHWDFKWLNIPNEERITINTGRVFTLDQKTNVRFIDEDILVYERSNNIYIANLKKNTQLEYTGVKTHLERLENNKSPELMNILSHPGLFIYVDHAFLNVKNDPIAHSFYFMLQIDDYHYGIHQLQIKKLNPSDEVPSYCFAGNHKLISAPIPYFKYPELHILFYCNLLYLIDYPQKDNFNIYSLDISQPGQELKLEISSYQFELTEPNYKKVEDTINPVPGFVNISPAHLSLIETDMKPIRWYEDCIDALDTIIIHDAGEYKFFNARLDKIDNLAPVREISNKLDLELPDEILLDVAYMAYKPAPVYCFNLMDSIPVGVPNSNLANINWAETVKYTIQDDFKNPWLPHLSPANPNPYEPIFNNNTTMQLLDTEYDAYVKAYKENTPIYEPKIGKCPAALGLNEPQYKIIYPVIP